MRYLQKHVQAVHDAIAQKLFENGTLVRGGWLIHRRFFSDELNQVELMRVRDAFYAGAQHVLACMMIGLEEGVEPTDNDLQRMQLLERELEEWATSAAVRYTRKPEGSA